MIFSGRGISGAKSRPATGLVDAVRALGALTPALVAKELAHIGGSDVDRRVAVHADRTRALTVSNRRKLHGGEYGTGRGDAVTSRLDIVAR